MGFKGFYFNNYKQKYLTYKYPHCYVGIKKDDGMQAGYGLFNKEGQGVTHHFYNKLGQGVLYGGEYEGENFNPYGYAAHHSFLNKKGVGINFGINYIIEGSNNMATQTYNLNLTEDNFIIDTTKGFNMAVEKTWHKCNPVELDPNPLTLYDIEGRQLEPSKYALTLYYKLVIPLSFFPTYLGNTKNDLLRLYSYYNGVNRNYYATWITTFEKGTPIGTPVLPCSGEASCKRGLLIDPQVALTHPAYKLPDKLNETDLRDDDFAIGANIENGWGNLLTAYTSLRGITNSSTLPLNSNVTSTRFLFMNNGLHAINQGALGGFGVTDTAASYTVDVSAALMNMPTSTNKDNTLKFMPELFKPFGMMFYCNEYFGTDAGCFLANRTSGQYSEEELETLLLTASQDQSVRGRCGWIYYVFGVKEMS